MTLPVAVAELILLRRFGEPAKPPTQKVIGFKTSVSRVLALHREANETRIWFQKPAPPNLQGVMLMPETARNDNLNGPLSVLNTSDALRVEVEGELELNRFLDWYERSGQASTRGPLISAGIDPNAFREAFSRFIRMVAVYDKGNAFTSFQEGVVGGWENYKPHLRDLARRILDADGWTESGVGSGAILKHTIDAIEIQDSRTTLTNNLVFWQNRFGHANRDHRALLEAVSNPKLRQETEQLLFGLYRGEADEAATFGRLSELSGAKYPLVAYLYFLRDMDRFMPIQPTGFDRAFRELGIDFVTLRNCNWENYAAFNAILGDVRLALEDVGGLKNVRLIDAHSFCWIFAHLLKQETEGQTSSVSAKTDSGRVLGARERSIIDIKYSIIQTAQQARGQSVDRTVQTKVKNLGFDDHELEAFIRERMRIQQDRCALTGIPFHFKDESADLNLLPSPDRIDSDGHYEPGNLQIVCRFVNFWKRDTPNEEFKRLLGLVRGVEAVE